MSVQQFIIHMIPIKLQRQRVRLTESVLIARQYDKRSSYLCAVFKSLIACSKLRVGVGGIGMFPALYLLLQRQRTWGVGGLEPSQFLKGGGLSPPKIWLSMGQMKNVKYFVMPDIFRVNIYSKLHEHRAPAPPPPPPTFDMLSMPLYFTYDKIHFKF